MKKKVINQILRRLGFEYNDYAKNWAVGEKVITSRYRSKDTNTVALKRPTGMDAEKSRTGLNFIVNKGWDNVFEKSLAQLTEDELYLALKKSFPELKGLRRRDVLDDLLNGLD